MNWLRELAWHYPSWPVSLMGLARARPQPVRYSVRCDAVCCINTLPTCANLKNSVSIAASTPGYLFAGNLGCRTETVRIRQGYNALNDLFIESI